MIFSDGKIQLEDGDLDRFQEEGWDIDIHASNENGAYYFNHIGITFMGMEVGFCSWKDNLSLYVASKEVKISSQEDLTSVLRDMRKMHSEFSPLIKDCSIADMFCTGEYCY